MNDQNFSWTVRVRVKKGEEVLFGSGPAKLLYITGYLGSLHAAAAQMHMSYRKALGIVRRSEEMLGHPLLKKVIGGAGGGGSVLTPYAQNLLSRFQTLEQQLIDFTDSLTQDFFTQLEYSNLPPEQE